jgi:UDP-N-acetyl-D-galactosamine dehydrogenase
VIDVYKELRNFDIEVDVFDPLANKEEVKNEYNIEIYSKMPNEAKYSAIVLAVGHKLFKGLDVRKLVGNTGIVYDVKGIFPKNIIDGRL